MQSWAYRNVKELKQERSKSKHDVAREISIG